MARTSERCLGLATGNLGGCDLKSEAIASGNWEHYCEEEEVHLAIKMLSSRRLDL